MCSPITAATLGYRTSMRCSPLDSPAHGPRRGGGTRVERTAPASDRSILLHVLSLGVLGVFKYYSFFAQQWANLLGEVGLGPPLPLLTIALPVGISFFTFQAISYVVDVKRRHVAPASLLDFTVYLSFFPHLVAGPI